jgi:hypothetical protein
MKMFVDTCVWRYWLTLKNGRDFENCILESHAKHFDQIYKIVSSKPLKHVFLYNTRIEGELPDSYLYGLTMSFYKIKENPYFIKIPIPLSRAGGTYKADGSLLAGGFYGGTLMAILSMDGYDHKAALQNAAPNYRRENPAHTKPRIKEFDVEHLESALEARADLFITADQLLIDRLSRAFELLPVNPTIMRANEICATPKQALSVLNEA